MPQRRHEIRAFLSTTFKESQLEFDEQMLNDASVDRFRKYEAFHGVYTQPTPAAIIYAESVEDVVRVLEYANQNGVNVVARSGGSATEGGLETALENSLVLDGSRMNRIVSIDVENMQATAQCGTSLQALEDAARAQGLTTGHSPQSKPLAQMGGLVATRSIGQFSTLYGGIEDMVVGLEAVFPELGITKIKNVPRRAAGPDIRHVITGNEGALCFITEVTVKLFKYFPDSMRFLGFALDSMATGVEILREVMVNGYRPSVARLYDVEDGAYYFSEFAADKCVLIFATEGPPSISRATADSILEIVLGYSECQEIKPALIQHWFEHLNWDESHIAAEKKEIIETRSVGSTTEVAANWSGIMQIYENCLRRIPKEVPDVTSLGAHSSHSYQNGTNLYFVYYYDVSNCATEEEITKYHLPIKEIIVEETLKAGGSMCHHHGVGKHRAQWIEDEYGTSYSILETLKKSFDPNSVMNMGTIIPLKSSR